MSRLAVENKTIALDKAFFFFNQKYLYFSKVPVKTYVVGTHSKCPSKALLMGTYNICFRQEIRKMFT